MKCDTCAFLLDKIDIDLCVFYRCKIKGITPKADCPYYKKQNQEQGKGVKE